MEAVPLCRKCGLRPSTGIIFDLCDPCWDEFEEQIKLSGPGKYKPTDKELEYVAEGFLDRKD
jgi:hypothetical protein